MNEKAEDGYLTVSRLRKKYGGLWAVNGLDITMRKGETLSVIGPNGAGKTTLLNLISGAIPITAGEISYKGHRIEKLPSHRICALGIARTFQNLQLFMNMTVVENVMMGYRRWMRSTLAEVMLQLSRARREQRLAHERAMEKLDLLGLAGKARSLPSSLTLRERKALAIARALASEPEMLLLDEPVGGLTLEEIQQIAEKIQKIREQGVTILFIEHRMEFVKGLSERVIVMEFGQKIAEGTFDQMLRNEHVVAAYLGKARQ